MFFVVELMVGAIAAGAVDPMALIAAASADDTAALRPGPTIRKTPERPAVSAAATTATSLAFNLPLASRRRALCDESQVVGRCRVWPHQARPRAPGVNLNRQGKRRVTEWRQIGEVPGTGGGPTGAHDCGPPSSMALCDLAVIQAAVSDVVSVIVDQLAYLGSGRGPRRIHPAC